MAAWADSCPLTGTCAECGLQVDWANVLSSKRQRPRWCVEYPTSPRNFFLRFFCTLLRAFWPWSFWRSLRVSHEIRVHFILIFVLTVCLFLYALFCIGQGLIARHQRLWLQSTGYTNGEGPLVSALQAMILPFSEQGGVLISTGANSSLYVASPRQTVTWWIPDTNVYFFYLVMLILSALSFHLLRTSMRAAKVRPLHVVRIGVYFAPWVLVCWIGESVTWLAANLGFELPDPRIVSVGVIYSWSLPAVLLIWTQTATLHYLQLRHSWAIALGMTAIGILGAATVTNYVDSSFLRDIFLETGLGL